MPSARLQLLLNLKARVEKIQVVNGFDTDAGLLVFVGEALSLGPDDPDAAIAILVGDDDPGEHSIGDQDSLGVRLPINLAALVKADLAQPHLTAESIISDIKRAVETADPWPADVHGEVRGPTRTLEREEGSTTVGMSIQYEFLVIETWGAP